MRKAVCLFAALLLIAATPTGLLGQSSSKNVPAKGKQATDFELTAVAGEMSGKVKLADVTKQSPVVLVVLRGYPGYQCGMCSRQVSGLLSKAEQFQEKGVKVLMVYPGPGVDLEQRAEEFLKGAKLPAPFTMLLDPDYKFTNAYGLRWKARGETAYPSTFVIDSKGKIQYAKISKSHGGRSNPAEILAAL